MRKEIPFLFRPLGYLFFPLKHLYIMKLFTLCIILFLFVPPIISGKTYNILNYGAQKENITTNTTTAVYSAIKAIKSDQTGEAVTLTFPKGTYHFFIDSLHNYRKAFELLHLKQLTIDGNGSEFIFHGPLMIGSIDSCENIRLCNFSIDWERPYITQGVVVGTGERYVDLKIDFKEYPYHISKDSIFRGIGEGWSLGIETYNLYDKERREIVYRTRDMPLGREMFVRKSVEVIPGVVRFFGRMKFQPENGTYVALWHGRYMTEGFNCFGSKNLSFENIDMYHCPSHGLVGIRCEDISVKNVNMRVNEKKDRVFSLIADAFHFNACKGLIQIDSCTHTGQGDDFINVHGMYVQIANILDERTFLTGTSGRQNMTIGPGDELWFIKNETLKREETNQILSIIDTLNHEGKKCRKIVLKKNLPAWIKPNDFVENKSYLADLEIRNCNILKKHRARGILVTTPGKVIIENNYFRTAGAAILIEGDITFWYESGACRDVRIRNNVFEDCFTSGPEWGEAVITITPSYKPDSEDALCFHENIFIENNTFRHYDYAILYARAVCGLYFKNNTIERTYIYKPFGRKSMFYLDGCKQIDIFGNKIGKEVLGKNISLINGRQSDIIRVDTCLTVEEPIKK